MVLWWHVLGRVREIMKILGVCLAILAGAFVVENGDVITGTAFAILSATMFYEDARQRRIRATLKKSEQNDGTE